MISLAAWMTVSTSALSKLSTTKRPRCSRGTGGAVGGCGMGGGGLGSTAGCAGVTVRGPTDVGGRVGRGSGPGGGVGIATGGVVCAAGGLGLGAAHPEARASRTRIATKRLTLVLRHRLRVVGVDRRGREASAEARRGPRERRGARKARRGLPGLYYLRTRLTRREHPGDPDPWGRRGRLNGAGHGRLTLDPGDRLALDGCLAAHGWGRRPRLRRVAQAHVDHAVGPRDHDRVGRDRLHRAPGDRIADPVACDALGQWVLEVRDRRTLS